MASNRFFSWLLVFYLLTDAYVLVLFHVVYITSTSSMQKQSFTNVFTYVLESLFNKVEDLLLIKLQTFRPATLLKRLQHRFYPVKFPKFLRTPFFTEHLWWLLLSMLLFLNVFSWMFFTSLQYCDFLCLKKLSLLLHHIIIAELLFIYLFISNLFILENLR